MVEQKEICLSGFADEAGVSLEEQIRVLKRNGIHAIEMRGVNDKHVLEASEEEWKWIRDTLEGHGFVVSAIGSPVGKSPVGQDFGMERERFARALDAAHALGCRYIRAFSFFIPEGEPHERFTQEVLYRMGELTAMAEERGKILALENESGIYTDTLSRCREVLEAIASPALCMAFDSGNYIKNGTEPYPEAYRALKDRVGYFHIKDAAPAEEHFLAAGQGTGRIGEMLREAYGAGFRGWLSVEPHLGYRREWNRAQQFTAAVNALKEEMNRWMGTAFATVPLGELAE